MRTNTNSRVDRGILSVLSALGVLSLNLATVLVLLFADDRRALPSDHLTLLHALVTLGVCQALYSARRTGQESFQDSDWIALPLIVWLALTLLIEMAAGLVFSYSTASVVLITNIFHVLECDVFFIVALYWRLASIECLDELIETKVPRALEFLLFLFLPKQARMAIAGDLYEDYTTRILPKFGRFWANLWYCLWVVYSILAYFSNNVFMPCWQFVILPGLKWIGIPASILRVSQISGLADYLSTALLHMLK